MLSPEAQLLLACARRAADREAVRRCVAAVTAWDVPPGAYGAPKSVALAHEVFEEEGQQHLDRGLESAGAADSGVPVEKRLLKGDARGRYVVKISG